MPDQYRSASVLSSAHWMCNRPARHDCGRAVRLARLALLGRIQVSPPARLSVERQPFEVALGGDPHPQMPVPRTTETQYL